MKKKEICLIIHKDEDIDDDNVTLSVNKKLSNLFYAEWEQNKWNWKVLNN